MFIYEVVLHVTSPEGVELSELTAAGWVSRRFLRHASCFVDLLWLRTGRKHEGQSRKKKFHGIEKDMTTFS